MASEAGLDNKHASSNVERRSKRHKGTLACNECREKKRRCDGSRPICATCSRRGTACVWNTEGSAKLYSASYVLSLHAKIRRLEMTNLTSDPYGSYHGVANDSPSQDGRPNLDSQQSMGDALFSNYEKVPGQRDKRGDIRATPSPEEPRSGFAERNAQENSFLSSGSCPRTDVLLSLAAAEAPPGVDEDHVGELDVNAMGTASGGENRVPDTMHTSDVAKFGPSSIASFLSRVRRRLGTIRNGAAATSGPPKSRGIDAVFSRSHSRMNIGQQVLPPKSDTDKFLAQYFTRFHSLYPFINKPMFLDRYEMVWLPMEARKRVSSTATPSYIYFAVEETGERLFYAMLNAVLAIGSQLDDSIDSNERSEVSQTFYHRARGFVGMDELGNCNLPLVQTLLLMGQYLQSTDKSDECWNTIGLAVRIAQGMGLHLETHPESDGGPPSEIPLEGKPFCIELRRRTWIACVTMDRISSINYGRPPLIVAPLRPQTTNPIPFADELIAITPGNDGDTVSCWGRSVELLEVLTVIHLRMGAPIPQTELSVLLGHSSGQRTLQEQVRMGKLTEILEFDRIIRKWRSTLPKFLKLDHARIADEHGHAPQQEIHRHACHLHLRLLTIRMILFRPVLIYFFENQETGMTAHEDPDDHAAHLNRELMVKLGALCVESATEMVTAISRNLELRQDLLPVWWYAIYYIHHCGIIILVGRVCKDVLGIDDGRLRQCWQYCLDCLKLYSEFGTVAESCIKLLEALESGLLLCGDPMRLFDDPKPQLRGHQGDQALNHLRDHSATEQQSGLGFHGEHELALDQELPYDFNDVGFPPVEDGEEMAWLTTMPFEANGLFRHGANFQPGLF